MSYTNDTKPTTSYSNSSKPSTSFVNDAIPTVTVGRQAGSPMGLLLLLTYADTVLSQNIFTNDIKP